VSAQSNGASAVLERLPRPASGASRPYQFPRFERTALPNGLKLVIAPIAKLPIATITILVDAGGVCDPPGRYGLAQLTAKLLLEGTASGDGTAIIDRFERLGASIEKGNVWSKRSEISFSSARTNGSLFLGMDTLLGPVYFATGFDEGGNSAYYLFLGRTF
jgi:predicted Zn-dependent peptidase